jgi:tetratricopeptide (TPR) repeat protein
VRNQDLPLRAEFRGLPEVPEDQVVTGLIPHEPPNFQTPAALELLSSPVCVLTGPRGVGKTQVAAAYARQRVRDGWLVAWIGAETEDQVKASMAELADRLGLYRPEDTADVTCARVRNHLQTRLGSALLVFDNVVSLDLVRPYLPSVGPAQVVITSTVRGSQIGREVPVDVFSSKTAEQFLLEATGIDGPADDLSREVGYLPLALAQAAARIRAARWSFAKYLENFRKFPAEKYLNRRDGDPYPLGAATAILMALEPFEGSELVEMLAVLSPDGVSRQVLGDSADDELVLLHEASLVEFAGDSSVIMHRLVQRVIRDRGRESSTDQHSVERAAVLLNEVIPTDDELWASRHFGAELVRQIESLTTNLAPAAADRAFEMTVALRLWTAHFLSETTDLARAGLIARDTHAEAIARLGEGHDLSILARLLVAKAMSNRSEDFLDLMERDLARSREEFGAEHANTLGTAVMLSRHYLEHQRTEEAVDVLEQVLEPWHDRPYDTAMVLGAADSLGSAYVAAGRLTDAITVLERCLQASLLVHGLDSKATTYTMSLLAEAYGLVGRSAEALAFHEHVCGMRRKILGPDHPTTLYSVGKFGIALIKDGQTNRAKALLQHTLALAREVLGEEHQTTIIARTVLAAIQED